MAKGSTIYELKIQLKGATKPPIWRKVHVSAADSLSSLHGTIQNAMGWEDCHLHHFEIRGTYYSSSSLPGGLLEDTEDADKVPIGKAFGTRLKAHIEYEYDFGDSWVHTITLEDILEAAPNVNYPTLIAGKGACPLEDCGGMWGYEEMKEVFANPKHANYKEMVEMYGKSYVKNFDPSAFDLKTAQEKVF